MWVKICGNTRLEDCLLAAELGADAVGFVFAPGKRTVSVVQVAAITAHLPPALEKVGVFTTGDADAIGVTVNVAGLTAVQLHTAYDPQLAQNLRQRFASGDGIRLIQVVHWQLGAATDQQRQVVAATLSRVQQDGFVDAILVDTSTAQSSGGTGRTFDWNSAAPVLNATRLPIIVAGGLQPANVADAIAILAPSGVDVSSGVEHAPGIKDTEQVKSFIAHARR